jgi:hypothetical protein
VPRCARRVVRDRRAGRARVGAGSRRSGPRDPDRARSGGGPPRTTAPAGTPIRSPHRGLIRSSRNFFGGNAGGSHALPLGSQFQPLLGEIEQHSRVLGAPGRFGQLLTTSRVLPTLFRIAEHSAKAAKKAAAEGASDSTERMSAPLIGAAVPGPLPRPFGRGTAHNVATSSRLLVESP